METEITELHNKLTAETKTELEFSAVLSLITKHCMTSQGKELIFNADFPSLTILNKELKEVNEMVELNTTDETFPLEKVEEVKDAINRAKIDGSVLEIIEMQHIVTMIRLAKTLKIFITKRKEKYPLLNDEIFLMYDNTTLQKKLDATVDENGTIKDNATPELARIRTELREKNSRLHSKMTKLAKEFAEEDLVNDNFYTIKDGRFVLPIKSNYKRHLSGIIHGTSQTGSTVYLEPTAAVELNNELSLLHSAELREIHNILQQLTREVARDAAELLDLYDIISHIDAVNAKAQYAINNAGIMPIIAEDKILELKNVYHPLLINKLGRKNVIPLTISFKYDNRGHLISGPNAGGKTIAMKTTGLSVMMALAGIFPIGEVRLYPMNVYSSIGDGQSLEQNLSTFSFQLTRIKDILDVADNNSLILIDEICSGTDPREGAALAAGILDTFIELNLFFIVTTHQSSLKTYALTLSNSNKSEKKEVIGASISPIGAENHLKVIQNDSFAFDEEQLRPTYVFQAGLPGNSFAFFLAKTIGLSSLVLKRARKYLGGRHKQLERSITTLQKHKKEYESLVLEYRRNILELNKIKEGYINKEKGLTDKKNRIINDAKLEADKILSDASLLVENTIRELREAKQSSININQSSVAIKKAFMAEKDKISLAAFQIRQEEIAQNKDIQVAVELFANDTVGMLESAGTGVVLEANNLDKVALVAFNGLKFRLPFNRLYLKSPSVVVSKVISPLKLDVQTKLDLRGYRADAALHSTEQFISQALEGNVDYISIIHGKGSGILREVIHNYLKSVPEVKRFRLGELYEGGSGATFVYFR